MQGGRGLGALGLWIGLFLLSGAASRGFADDQVPAGASASAAESTYDFVKEHLAASYFGQLSGTNLEFQGYHPNPDGTDSELLGIWNTLGLGYKVTSDIQVDATLVWDWFIAGGHRWVMQPPRIGASGQLYASDLWSVWSNLNLELPVTATADEAGLLTSLGTFNEIWFNPTRTGRLQLGGFHSLRVFAYSQPRDGNRIEGTITPAIRYRLAPRLDAQLAYSVDYALGQGQGIAEVSSGLTQIQPGLNWVINSHLSVMPYFIIQPQGDMDLASTSFGAWITGTIL